MKDRPSRPSRPGPAPRGGDRPFRAGGPKKSFRSRDDRGERGPRAFGEDRPRRAPRGEGPERGPRPFVEDRPRRAPRADRPDREDRGASFSRGPRREGGFGRSDRGPSAFRSDRGGSFDRGPRRERGAYPGRAPGPTSGPFQAPDSKDRPHLGKDELRYLGKNACSSLFRLRPLDIIRVYLRRDLQEEFSELLAFCSKNRKSYHLVDEADLERLTDSTHHEGICIVGKEKSSLHEKDFFQELTGARSLVLFLDGVGNPHNLGAILRTAAHFGIRFVAGQVDELPRLSPAAHRTSEGGSEHVSLVRVEDSERFLDRLKGMGYQIYAFEAAPGAVPLFETRLNDKSVFVMGAEVTGISGLMRAVSDVRVQIPGTGAVESLNVSVAAAVAMAEFQKQASAGRTVRIVKKNP